MGDSLLLPKPFPMSKINIMRNFIIIILFFFCGCYTQQKATEQLDKAQIKYPEIVAKKHLYGIRVYPKCKK